MLAELGEVAGDAAMTREEYDALARRAAAVIDRLPWNRIERPAKSPLQQLTERIAREGLHLHYVEGPDYWRTVRGRRYHPAPPLCGTQACFRLRLRNFEAEVAR